MPMVKCLPEFEYFTVILKNINFISKIRRSKVTDYAALKVGLLFKFRNVSYLLGLPVYSHHLKPIFFKKSTRQQK